MEASAADSAVDVDLAVDVVSVADVALAVDVDLEEDVDLEVMADIEDKVQSGGTCIRERAALPRNAFLSKGYIGEALYEINSAIDR